MERLAIALITGGLGFVVGMFVWWCFAGVPGFGLQILFPASLALGMACFLLGLWRPNETVEVLGFIGQKVSSLSSEVLSWFRLLR